MKLNKVSELLKSIHEDAGANYFFQIYHKGVGLVYLFALAPLFHQINALIGDKGLLPANTLITTSYKHQGLVKTILQFPSLYHIYPSTFTLHAIISLGITGAILLIFSQRYIFTGALLSWISFLSITSIGGDFFVIIIDLFLSEVGFLTILSAYCMSSMGYIPKLVRWTFIMLNFKLWFGMGINKFYLPYDVWKDLTFFDYFFQAQPMPTPLAFYLNQTPTPLKYLAIYLLFVVEVVVPFFLFGRRYLRIIALIAFALTSILIQISGNYGYFNILSIILLITILKDKDFAFSRLKTSITHVRLQKQIPNLIFIALFYIIVLDVVYNVRLFMKNQHSEQNHFNFIFNNLESQNAFINTVVYPFKVTEYFRICNPYGVFRGIPKYHGEIRFSGSYDASNWETYTFKYLPSSHTDYLGFYAPYYPRLDHLMFYETLSAQNFKFNPLNKFYNDDNTWIYNFTNALLDNNHSVTKLLKENPFENKQAPKYIKADIYRLSFSDDKTKKWNSVFMDVTRTYSIQNPINQEDASRIHSN